MKLSDISLGAKLWTAIGIVITLLLVTLLVAQAMTTNVRGQQEALASAQLTKSHVVQRWINLIEINNTRVMAGVAATDNSVNDFFKDKIPATSADISALQKQLESMDLSAPSRAVFEHMGQERKGVLESLGKIRTLKGAGDSAGARQESSQVFMPAIDRYVASLHEFAALQDADAIEAKKTIEAQSATSNLFARGMVGVIILIFLAGTYFLVGHIRRPLRAAISVTQQIADGNLSTRIDTNRGDEFGEMMRALSHMKDGLTDVVRHVRTGSDAVSTASAEIAQGNHDLSARTESQAQDLVQAVSVFKLA